MTDTVNMHVGELIRARRLALSMTLQTLSERAECAKSYLSSIENARRAAPPSDEVLHRIEAALDLPKGRLLELACWQRTPEPVRQEV